MPSETAWTVLTTAPSHTLAEILQGVLQAAGIPVMLAGESYATTFGLPTSVQVLVPSDQLMEAEAVLRDSEASADETDEDSTGQDSAFDDTEDASV